MARARGARAGALPDDAVPAAGDRDGRRRGDVADDLRARRRPAQPRPGRSGSARGQDWLGDFTLALPAVGLIGTWVNYGLAMVLLTAGVQKIPPSLYDAARVDGAGPFREFFAVTLPGLRGGDRGRADADHDLRAAQLRPRLHHDRAAGRATRPRCRRSRSSRARSRAARWAAPRRSASCLRGIIFVIALRINRLAERGRRDDRPRASRR